VASVWLAIEWVDGEPTYCNEKAVIEVAVEDFGGRFETICSGGPLVDQGFDEFVTVISRFIAQRVQS